MKKILRKVILSSSSRKILKSLNRYILDYDEFTKDSGDDREEVEGLFNHYDAGSLFKIHKDWFQNIANVEATKLRQYILTDQNINLKDFPNAVLIRDVKSLDLSQIRESIFYIYFQCDSDARDSLKIINDNGGKFIPHLGFENTSYRFINSLALKALKRTWEKRKRLSHLNIIVHENVCEAIEITKQIEGDYVEIGVFKGSSASTALNYIDVCQEINSIKPRKVWLLDTFDGFNYLDSDTSADVIWKGTHKLFGVEDTKSFLRETFNHVKTNYELVESNICEKDLPLNLHKIAVANIDVDLYEPTLAALKKVAPLIQPGGIIISEDPACTPALYGAYLALNEFLETSLGKEFISVFKTGQYFLIRKKFDREENKFS